MLPTFLLEPSPTDKRRAYAQALALPKQRPFPELSELRARLKSMRQRAVAELNPLEHRLVEALQRMPGIEVAVADDSQQAVQALQRACRTGDTIVVNQSSVVIQELAPALRESGFRVVDSYAGEFPAAENRFAAYRELPRATSDHIVESFSTSDLVRLRSQSIGDGGVQDFVAVLGVNAISADDGSVFFLQHSQNISKAFRQARKLVLVVTVDKIVPIREDARLQALGMGVFGWEIRLANLGKNGGANGTEEPPPLPPAEARNDVTVIVMDNGRKPLLDGPYRDLLLCIGCRACVRGCPTHLFMAEGSGWSPKEYLHHFLRGQSPSLDLCLNCGMCLVECPLDIDLPAMIMLARSERMPGRRRATTRPGDLERLGRWGSRMPGAVNLALRNPASRWFAERTLGVSRDAPLPRFHRDTLAHWLRARPGGKQR